MSNLAKTVIQYKAMRAEGAKMQGDLDKLRERVNLIDDRIRQIRARLS